MKHETVVDTSKGKWFSVPCAMNCGGRCVNKVLVRNGEIIRCKTDDAYEDSWGRPQRRACPIGWAQRQKVDGPDRIQYPLKRKHWNPGDPNGQLRGRDEWERISWDEALTHIATELKKSRDTYGPSSILYLNIINLEGYLSPVLARFGGYSTVTSVDSLGTYQFKPDLFGLQIGNINDRYDFVNADYIILLGANPAQAGPTTMCYFKPAHEKGVKFALVAPEYNETAGAMDAEWYPVHQGTDTAFFLGVAYSMVEQGVINQEFLDTYTVGFDAQHMPADAKTDQNFVDYLMGAYDGVKKTPQWASEMCGCPVDKIEKFARIMGRDNNVTLLTNTSAMRCTGSENLPHLLMTVGCMGGHYGKQGNACSNAMFLDNGAKLAACGMSGHTFVFNPFAVGNPVTDNIPSTEVWDAILNGKYHHCGDVLLAPTPCEEREVDIHVIVSEQNNRLQTLEGFNKGVEAFRSVDFVCSSATWLKTEAAYADIILPVASRWERQMYDFYNMASSVRDSAFAHTQVFKPFYESKSDYDIALELAEKLDVDVSDFLAIDEKQGWFNQIAQAFAYSDDESMESVDARTATDVMLGMGAGLQKTRPLVTITQEDIDRYGVEGTPQVGLIGLEEFLENGVWTYERTGADDAGRCIAYEDFIKDPENNPRPTPSGKFEIYCQQKSDWFDSIHNGWPNYTPVSPLPILLPTLRGYIQSFADWENKVRGEYPYQVSNDHNLRRAHTDSDNLQWLREEYPHPIFISKADAEEKGIRSGDIVIVWNQYGTILRRASVTAAIMPGTMQLGHGAAAQIDEETGYDLAGADNTLCASDQATAFASNGWNSTLVNFEKYEGPIDLLPDDEWAPRVIDGMPVKNPAAGTTAAR